ncbi:MAG: phosphate regulon sensor histidine kinase PhoR [Woeseiaceae bacterium]|nr:phosphate regulon sensor histidine kinase PhoR [Woeseiaceae bacterium]
MNKVRSKLVVGHIVLLAVGAVIGMLYDHADWGLLVAALLMLAWHVQRLLIFERAMRTKNFEAMRYAGGVWSYIYSRIMHMRNRSKLHKKHYRKLIKEIRKSANALPDGGIILNEEFEIIVCNSAAEKLAGFRHRQDRGQRVDNILRAPAFRKYLHSKEFDKAVEVPSPIREDCWLSCRIVPYGANQLLLLIRDITERRRMTAMRREFIANASHELRSPLTVISGYLDTLVSEPGVPEDWKKPLSQMQEQTARMNKIVAELLELSRLEGSGPAPEDEIIDVPGLLAAARKTYAGQQNVAEIKLEIQSQAKLQGSSSEIESVIDNLLSNALRYTAADGTVTLSWESDEDGARLSVSDTGIGIDEEHIPRVTERFFRVDPGRDRHDGGVGLGLAIVKHVLERHSARLVINSRRHQGSTFTCHFPRDRLAMADAIPIARNTA